MSESDKKKQPEPSTTLNQARYELNIAQIRLASAHTSAYRILMDPDIHEADKLKVYVDLMELELACNQAQQRIDSLSHTTQ